MRDGPNATPFFETLLNSIDPAAEKAASTALRTAAFDTRWERNQPCDSVIAGGRIACVLSGAVRKFAIRVSGQRQIIDLLISGDFFGLSKSDPTFLVEAVSNGTRVASFRKQQIDELASTFPAIAALIRGAATDAIGRLENHLLVQGRITAKAKVRAYLAEMCRRTGSNQSGSLALPITRYDIADHLGIAVETVSRAMTALRRRGSIALQTPRHIQIRDRAILADVH